MLAVVGLSCAIGASVQAPLLRRFFAGEFRQSFLDARQYTSIRFITLGEAQDLFQVGQALFVDSRSTQDFVSGHVPGALSVPLDEVKEAAGGRGGKEAPGSLDQILRSFSPDRTLVVYCEGGDCQTSIALARLLHDMGFRDIRVFEGGWAEWSAAGMPVEAGQ